jgi:hypothetical protein
MRHLILKAISFQVLYILLHFSYVFFPLPVLVLISGTSEAFFEHLKIGFYAYILLCGLEYLVRYRRISDKSRFFASRLFTTILIPWFIFIYWYISAAVYGKMPNDIWEIIYANISVFVVMVFVGILERNFEAISFTRGAKIVLCITFIILVVLFTVFTFHMPWTDVFEYHG